MSIRIATNHKSVTIARILAMVAIISGIVLVFVYLPRGQLHDNAKAYISWFAPLPFVAGALMLAIDYNSKRRASRLGELGLWATVVLGAFPLFLTVLIGILGPIDTLQKAQCEITPEVWCGELLERVGQQFFDFGIILTFMLAWILSALLFATLKIRYKVI